MSYNFYPQPKSWPPPLASGSMHAPTISQIVSPINVPYIVPGAVHFDSNTYLFLDFLRADLPDSDILTIAGWFKTKWDNSLLPLPNWMPVLCLDPSNASILLMNGLTESQPNHPPPAGSNFQTAVEFSVFTSNNLIGDVAWVQATGVNLQAQTFALAPFTFNVWTNIFYTVNTATADQRIWVNGIPIPLTETGDPPTGGAVASPGPFIVSLGGLQLNIASNSFGPNLLQFYEGDMAEVGLWLSYIPSGPVNNCVLANGFPMSPNNIFSKMGTPVIFLTGNASDFTSNSLGVGGGPFVTVGNLTDAATTPTGFNSP